MISMLAEERRKLLFDFLNRWSYEAVRKMKLTEYNQIGNNDSFCYWIEHKTKNLGSIIGMPQTIKFGIYNHKDESDKKRKKFCFDEKYVWLPAFGSTRNAAFEEVKSEILQIINFANTGNFEAIDNLRYTSFSKWKIAFLYSNERLIPIFKWSVLKKIAQHLGSNINDETPVSKVQNIIMSQKPIDQSVYEYAYDLWFRFSGKFKDRTKRGRKETKRKNIHPQPRSGSAPYIAQQIHNKIQQLLLIELCAQYGEENVNMEINYIDIRVNKPDGSVAYYEVKSDSYASQCVRNALGQILEYAYLDLSKPHKYSFIVVGQYPPFESDNLFINYIKKILKIELEYNHIRLS